MSKLPLLPLDQLTPSTSMSACPDRMSLTALDASLYSVYWYLHSGAVGGDGEPLPGTVNAAWQLYRVQCPMAWTCTAGAAASDCLVCRSLVQPTRPARPQLT